MKNVLKILGIIAIVAVIGFSMVSCGDDDDDSGGGGGKESVLTITNIPVEHKGRYIKADMLPPNDFGTQAIADNDANVQKYREKSKKIDGTTVALNTYVASDRNSYAKCTESGTYTGKVRVIISEEEVFNVSSTGKYATYKAENYTITYSKGSATVDFSKLEESFNNF